MFYMYILVDYYKEIAFFICDLFYLSCACDGSDRNCVEIRFIALKSDFSIDFIVKHRAFAAIPYP